MGALEKEGWHCDVEWLPKGRYIWRIIERFSRIKQFDLLVISKIQPLMSERFLIEHFASKIVLDFGDAIYCRKPKNIGEKPDESFFHRVKFAGVCRLADLVVAGNRFLAVEARRFASRIEVVPTPVDVSRYSGVNQKITRDKILVWIGYPENLMYLEIIRPILAQLTKKYSNLRLRIICSRFPDWPEIPMEKVYWSENIEVEALSSSDIGLMPLTDDTWTRGKCAFKILQYMAAGLPCVASSVGANFEAVIDGTTGFLVSKLDDWFRVLKILLNSDEKRMTMGKKGQAFVRQHYDTRVITKQFVTLFNKLVQKSVMRF